MFYFLYGTDSGGARKKLHELLTLAEKKRPGSEIFKLTTENWNENQFDELLISQGLFEQKYIVVLDNLFEKKEIKDYVLDRLKGLEESEQIFLILESKVDSASLKKISTKAKQVQEFEKKEEKKPSFNIFSITDNLIKKDKRGLWISYLDLLGKGAVVEEIHGIFFWQVKNMILVNKTKNSTETGLSPFVYRNASVGAKKYNENELIDMSSQLVQMTHKVRQGRGDLEVMLEKWILEIK